MVDGVTSSSGEMFVFIQSPNLPASATQRTTLCPLGIQRCEAIGDTAVGEYRVDSLGRRLDGGSVPRAQSNNGPRRARWRAIEPSTEETVARSANLGELAAPAPADRASA